MSFRLFGHMQSTTKKNALLRLQPEGLWFTYLKPRKRAPNTTRYTILALDLITRPEVINRVAVMSGITRGVFSRRPCMVSSMDFQLSNAALQLVSKSQVVFLNHRHHSHRRVTIADLYVTKCEFAVEDTYKGPIQRVNMSADIANIVQLADKPFTLVNSQSGFWTSKEWLRYVDTYLRSVFLFSQGPIKGKEFKRSRNEPIASDGQHLSQKSINF